MNVECWILNGRGRREKAPLPNLMLPARGRREANRETEKLLKQGVKVAEAHLEPLVLAIHRFPK